MAEHALKSISATAERDEAPPVRERPVAPAARPSDHGEFPGKDKRTDRRRIIRYALFALLPIAFVLGGHTYVSGGKIMSTDDAASAISAGAGAGPRSAASARSHGRQGAVLRDCNRRAQHRARQISRGFHDRILPRRYRSRLD